MKQYAKKTGRVCIGIWFFIGLVIMGCSSTFRLYEGSPRPEEEIVLIASYDLVVYTINAHKTHDFCTCTSTKLVKCSSSSNSTRYEVLPGQYTIVVSYCAFDGKSLGNETITINAQAGYRYFLRGLPNAAGTKWGVKVHENPIKKKD